MSVHIPIQNFYYMLCYAWDKWSEGQIVSVDREICKDGLNLLSYILHESLNHLFKRGFDRGYILHQEESSKICGKINFNSMLYHKKRKMVVECTYDELSHNVLHNQVIKTTLLRVLRHSELNAHLAFKLRNQCLALALVEDIPLQSTIFRKVTLHRNNAFYGFALKVCELLFQGYLASERSGIMHFPALSEQVERFRVFENFVRNFYRIKQSQFHVKRENIYWDFTAYEDQADKRLPQMQTDITLVSQNQKMIIDCKFKEPLIPNSFEGLKFVSSDLYQMSAYLNNLPDNSENRNCIGILLYPQIDRVIRNFYQLKDGKKLGIFTVNLDQEWQKIEKELLAVLMEGSKN